MEERLSTTRRYSDIGWKPGADSESIEATKPNIVWPVVGSQAIGFEAAVTASGYTGAIVDSALYSPGLLKIAAVAVRSTTRTTLRPRRSSSRDRPG